MKTLQQTRLIVIASAMLALTACAANGPVTVENSVEGRIAVHAGRVVDTNKAISDAVKQLAAQGVIPQEKAVQVIQTSVKLDTAAIQLADLLKIYDSFTPTTDPLTVHTKFDEIRVKVSEMGGLVTTLLVPIADEGARGKIAALVGALNSTLLTLSMELSQGVR